MPKLVKTQRRTRLGIFAGFRVASYSLHADRLKYGGSIRLVAENNWLRRILYACGAPRRWTRAV